MSDYIELTCTCGKVLKVPASRAGQTGKCARCGKSVTIPDLSTQQSDDIIDSSRSSKKSKKNRFCNQCGQELDRSGRCRNCDKKKEKKSDSKKKHSGLSITQLLLCFLAGLFVGIILGPGYLNILPTQESIIQFFSKFRSSEETPQEVQPSNDLNQPSNDWNQPSNDWNQQNNDWNQPSNDWNQQNNLNSNALEQKEKYLSLVINATQSAEQYLADLKAETSVLEEQKKKLSNYNLYSEMASKLLQESNTLQMKISDSIQYAKQVQSEKNWLQLKNAYDRLYPYTGKLTEKVQLVYDMRQEVQSIRSDIEKYDAYNAPKKTLLDNTPYIGIWYSNLKQYKDELDELLKKANPVNKSGYIKIQSMMSILKAFQRYPSEVHSVAEILKQSMQNKDVYNWIINRKDTAVTATQKKQAEVLEKFLQNSNQFILDIFTELQTLNQSVYNVRRDIYNIPDSEIQDLLNILKDINRKYSNEYELFHSAVLNFKQ